MLIQRGADPLPGNQFWCGAQEADQQPVHLHTRVPVEAAIERRVDFPGPGPIFRTGHRMAQVVGVLPGDVGQGHLGEVVRVLGQPLAPFMMLDHVVSPSWMVVCLLLRRLMSAA
jgi:hypothetical protein